MEGRQLMRGDDIPDTALECIFSCIEDASVRSAVSRVCKKWYDIDRRTRKGVTIACCYAIDPASLTRRFKALEAVKLKGKPRAAMFRLIPEDWGGYAKPWISEIAVNCRCLKSIHLRRMIATDEDLCMIAKERGHMLQVLKLEKCSGFSTSGLRAIAESCRFLRVLVLEESRIEEKGGRWLHELAVHNSSLEVLNFSLTDLESVSIDDLFTLATNCKSLSSLKLNELDLESLDGVLGRTTSLSELGGVSVGFNDDLDQHHSVAISLPTGLTSLVGLYYMGMDAGDRIVNALVQPIASGLKKVDLQRTLLTINGHCQLLAKCSNLEDLEVLNAIGDEGLEVIANNCKNLRRLRVEHGDGDRDAQPGFVTQRGLTCVALGCHRLENIAVYVSDLDNAALVAIARSCSKLKDFRLVVLDEGNDITERPLDDGVRAMMQGCPDMQRFAFYCRPGLLTDRGMGDIGRYGQKLRWALFGLPGETDKGLSLFADGCPSLERLEIRDCVFTEAGITAAILKMDALRHVWVQGFASTGTGKDLLPLKRASWNVEYIAAVEDVPGEIGQPPQFLAYRSLAGTRTDNPQTVVCLH